MRLTPRWCIVRRSPRALEVEIRARVAGRYCGVSICSWFRWEDRRRHVSVLVIWRERVMILRTWPRVRQDGRMQRQPNHEAAT